MSSVAVVETESASIGIDTVNIGTRKSQLAIAQVDLVRKQLQLAHPNVEYKTHILSTMADENQVKAFQDFNSKSIWTEELEQLLVDQKLDVIVHSLKDMPTKLPDQCSLGVICEREDPRDVLVMKAGSPYSTIQELPPGSVIGTSSVRRKAALSRHFPKLKGMDVRGNVNTRLRKLDAEDSPYSCLILAAAGLKRIDLDHRISQYLTASDGMLYAPGQGALALETRLGDTKMLQLLSTLSHHPTTLACLAERSLLATLEGGCSAPIGVTSQWEGGELTLRSAVISLDGQQSVDSSVTGAITDAVQAEALGRKLAADMLNSGADKILEEIKAGQK